MGQFFNHLTAWSRRSPVALVLAMALAWFCFYLALTPKDHDRVVAYEPAAEERVPLGPRQPDGPATPLETLCPTFNVVEMSMSALDATLKGYFDLTLEYPPEAAEVEITALEKGGNSWGAILSSLLAEHDYALFRQDKTVRVIPAVFRENGQEGSGKQGVRVNRMRTRLKAQHALPVDLWINAKTPVRLRIDAQPFFGETTERLVGLKLAGYRDGEMWFSQVLDARVGTPARIETRGQDLLVLLITVHDFDETTLDMEVQYSHEYIE